jgi:hypothetical protein
VPPKTMSAALFVPEDRTLPVLREAVQLCRGCDLYRHATQAVSVNWILEAPRRE